MERHAHRPGADCIFETNHVLRLIIRWTTSVDRADSSTACLRKIDAWEFLTV